jgi:hypothetical protein
MNGDDSELQRKLTHKENEFLTLRIKYDELLNKIDSMESDVLFHKKRYELSNEKNEKEKQQEILS